ncbi:MAG: M48 family metallopeptidase [Phycisphaerales bacterium]|nr:M48 family metallopeptidase [Phycisphaerales bacterium]
MSHLSTITRSARLLAITLALPLLLAACSTNPTTGRKQLTGGLNRDAEVSIGNQYAPQLTNEMGGESKNPLLRDYITEVGMKLKDHTEVDGPRRTWQFILLDSDVINAFALPGEKVFMSRGLADKLTTEAQLAGVLGHEIGHVMARHTAERMGQAQVGQGLLAIGGALLGNAGTGAQIAMQGGQLFVGGTLLKFSRDQETEADTLGMRYMTKAGYNPRGQLEVMEVLKRASGSGGGPEILATHPLPQTRIDDIRRLLQGEYAYTQTGPDAGNYQDYADRYRQRYLAVRGITPGGASPANPAGGGGNAKPDNTRNQLRPRAAIDDNGRVRYLASALAHDPAHFDLDNPLTWCGVCRADAGLAAR